MQAEWMPQAQDSVELLYLTMDLSKKSWALAFGSRQSSAVRSKSIAAWDIATLQEEIVKARKRFKLGDEVPVVIIHEAGQEGFALYRQLTALGYWVGVVNSSSIEVSRQQRQAKTDGIDAGKLLQLLTRAVQLREPSLRFVRVPSVEMEDLRHLPRERQELVSERTTLTNRLGSLLMLHGLAQRPTTVAGLTALLREAGLPAHLTAELERLGARWAMLNEQIADVERTQAKLTTQAVEAHRAQQPLSETQRALLQIDALMRLGGIGMVTAWVTVTELFGWRGFRNRREVAGFLGLTPTPGNSGQMVREQGISKAGNANVRALLIEIAWGWLRHQPASRLTQWYTERFAGQAKRQKRVGIVAVARKLAISLWMYLETGEMPPGARLKGGTPLIAAEA